MSEVERAELLLRDLEQQQFVKWMRERVLRGDVPIEYLKEAARLPYKRAIKNLDNHFREFILHEVGKRISVERWDVVSFEIGRDRFTSEGNFAAEFTEQLGRVFEREYGVSGKVPHRFVSAIISEIENGVREISSCLYGSSEHRSSTQRHGGRVAPQAVRAACLVCRELEGLTNLFVEIIYYISNKSFVKKKVSSKTNWSERINFIKSFHYHKSIIEIQELIIGSSYPMSINEVGLANILDEIRDIRNKIAHPADVQIGHMEKLVELSKHTVERINRACPMLARISEVVVSSTGAVQVGLYLEVDHHREQPRLVFYEDLLNLGQSIDSSMVDKEVIVFPVRLSENGYNLDDENPIILLRKDNIVSDLHESLVIDIPVVVYYSEAKEEQKYIPEQEVEEIP